MKPLCEDTLAHNGTSEIPFATKVVCEYMGGPNYDQTDGTVHEFNVCGPCADSLTSNPWLRVKLIGRLISEADEVELRAQGLITDPVPFGSDRATPDWTGRVESAIVNAENMHWLGNWSRERLDAVVNELARIKRVRRARQAAKELEISKAMWLNRLIDTPKYHAEVNSARKYAAGVSLAKV